MTRKPPQALPLFPAVPAADAALTASWELSLKAARKAESTRTGYLLALRQFARWLAHTDGPGLLDVLRADVERYIVWMQEEACTRRGKAYEPSYINGQYRAIQQFYKWASIEEEIEDPTRHMSPPTVDEKVVPVLTDPQISTLLKTVEGYKDWESRRDLAIIRMFLKTGCRLTELANLMLSDVDPLNLSALVTGKGGKQRVIKFDAKTGQALDRYMRVRAASKMAARSDRLWLGTNHRMPLTPNGVRQVITRRAEQAGFHIHPHLFRHYFSHTWLDKGGSEGDLMELNGWSSPQMLRRYGRSARAARAQRAYDRIMGDL